MTNTKPFVLNPAGGNAGALIRGACLALACALSVAGCGDIASSTPRHPVAEASAAVPSADEEVLLAGEPLDAYECQLAPSTDDASASAEQASDKARAFAPITLTGCSEAH